MASFDDGFNKRGAKQPGLKNKCEFYKFYRDMKSEAHMINAVEMFMKTGDMVADIKLDADGNKTYYDHFKKDARLVGIILSGVQHEALSDKLHVELTRIEKMLEGHVDIDNKKFKHVVLMRLLEAECEKGDYHSRKVHTKGLEMSMQAFDGLSFEKYSNAVNQAINACRRAGIELTDDYLVSTFDTYFNPDDQSWNMWKEAIMLQTNVSDDFDNIMQHGIARERQQKLANMLSVNGRSKKVSVNVSYKGNDNDNIVYDAPRGGKKELKPWLRKYGGKGGGKGFTGGKGSKGGNGSASGKGRAGGKGSKFSAGGKGSGRSTTDYYGPSVSHAGKTYGGGKCWYCDQPGHRETHCYAKKNDYKQKKNGVREGVGAIVNFCTFEAVTTFDCFKTFIFLAFIAMTFMYSLTVSFASTILVCMFRVVNDERVLSLNTTVGSTICANELTFDTAAEVNVVNDESLVHRRQPANIKIIGVTGQGHSSFTGFLNIRLRGVNYRGIPKIVTLQSGIAEMSDWEPDTIIYSDAPTNCISASYVRAMGLGFHDDPGAPAYLWHKSSRTRIVLERRNNLLFLPVVRDE